MAKNVASKNADIDENGNGPLNRFPFIRDPVIKISGIPKNKNAYHATELRQISNRERKPLKP